MKRLQTTPVLCTAFVLLWSSGFIGAKYGLGYAGTFTLLTWRYALVTLILVGIVTVLGAWRRLAPREIGRHAVVGALAHAGWLSLVLVALDLGISTGLVAFITALQPMLTGALSASITGETTSRREWFGLVIGVAAVLFVVGDKIALGGAPIAYALPFFAVVAITVASLIERRAEVGGHSTAPVTLKVFIHCAASLVVLTPLAYGVEAFEAEFSPGFIFSVAWLALVVSLVAYGLMFILLRRIPAVRVASLTYLSPPTTILLAFFLFGEKLTIPDVIGLTVAAVAVWLTTRQA